MNVKSEEIKEHIEVVERLEKEQSSSLSEVAELVRAKRGLEDQMNQLEKRREN